MSNWDRIMMGAATLAVIPLAYIAAVADASPALIVGVGLPYGLGLELLYWKLQRVPEPPAPITFIQDRCRDLGCPDQFR